MGVISDLPPLERQELWVSSLASPSPVFSGTWAATPACKDDRWLTADLDVDLQEGRSNSPTELKVLSVGTGALGCVTEQQCTNTCADERAHRVEGGAGSLNSSLSLSSPVLESLNHFRSDRSAGCSKLANRRGSEPEFSHLDRIKLSSEDWWGRCHSEHMESTPKSLQAHKDLSFLYLAAVQQQN